MIQGEWDWMKKNPMGGLLGPVALAGLGAMMNKKKPLQGALMGLAGSSLLSPILQQGILGLGAVGRDKGRMGTPGMPGYKQWNNRITPQGPVPAAPEPAFPGPYSEYTFNSLDEMPNNFRPSTAYSRINIGRRQ